VFDGDTIKVKAFGARRDFYTVRLLGIDTPATKKPGTPLEVDRECRRARSGRAIDRWDQLGCMAGTGPFGLAGPDRIRALGSIAAAEGAG